MTNKLVLGMISEDHAITKDINVARTNLLYLFLVSVVVAIGFQIGLNSLCAFQPNQKDYDCNNYGNNNV
jgi:hypothetical protein